MEKQGPEEKYQGRKLVECLMKITERKVLTFQTRYQIKHNETKKLDNAMIEAGIEIATRGNCEIYIYMKCEKRKMAQICTRNNKINAQQQRG